MILAAQITAAVFSLFSLPVNRLPDISVPRVTVETVYPGMAANEIRSLVTIPVEDALSPVKGLEKMKSVSRDNRSLISMDFRWGTDPAAASVLVREAVDAVYPSLPQGVRKPTVTSDASANEPHAVIAVSSRNGNAAHPQAAQFARKLAEYELRARLRRIDGVSSVILVGGEITEERLSLDAPRLAALGLSPGEFTGLLSREISDIPAGNAREGSSEIVIISSGKPESAAALAKITLPAANGTLAVEDAGRLDTVSARRESVFVYNGKEACALEIYRRPGADPLRLSKEIKKTVDEAASFFSGAARVELVNDSSPSLLNGITNLVVSACLAAAAVFFVLLIFIRRFKYSLLASFSIPFSAAAGICALALGGRSLNGMSLAGLAMGIGLVSDISVIVLDLLHRAFGKQSAIPEPEEIGNKVCSIAGSSAASTITTALVFVPVITLPGPLGSLFGDIAIALVVSVIAGWFYAQFCLPSIYRMFFGSNLKAAVVTTVVTDGSLEKKYSRYLLFLLRKPLRIKIAAIFLVVTGIVSLSTRQVVFINPDEADEILVSVISPPGTLLEAAVLTSVEISRLISGLPSVKTVYGRAGAEEEDTGRRADIDYVREELVLRCALKKGVKPAKALAEIRDAVTSRFPISARVYFPKDRTEELLGLSAEHTFVIRGKDREELTERAETARQALDSAEISANFRPLGQRPQLRLYPDREASAYLSISAAQIAETLYVLNEGLVAARLEIEGRPIDVRVTGLPVRSIEEILLKTPQGKNVYLGSIGRIERKESEASLARLDRSDVFYTDILSEKIPVKKIPQFSWFIKADESAFNRYKNSLFIYAALVLILLYLAMGAQFESFLLPFVLMTSIPFSLAGAGPALLIAGGQIDSGAVLGLTALFGLVVNSSLVLFEISDQKIKSGMPVASAVFCGAKERMRAILITTATTVFALLPLILSPLGNSQKSMATAMIGGLVASTLISLFAVPPVLIAFFKRKQRSYTEAE
jgi:multidrug efflux pump subunit AcrB